MKLKSFGCSFIFGTDLRDDGRNGPYATGSLLTWPALLAQHLDCSYSTHARPGSGNLQILERLLNAVNDDQDTIYVIGWSWIDRFDYIDPTLSSPWPGTKWKTLMPVDQTPCASTYYRELHAEYSDKFSSLIYIDSAIQALRRNHCKFIMTYMDHLIFCDQWHTTPACADLAARIRPFLSDFDGQNFLDWSRDRNYEISISQHPLEQAHAAAADYVMTHWNQYLKC